MFIDFAGLFLRKMYFLVIDAHSKWDEVFPMAQTTATKKLEILRQVFASYRFPEQIVSDNGPHVISEDFHQFITRHICCAPMVWLNALFTPSRKHWILNQELY